MFVRSFQSAFNPTTMAPLTLRKRKSVTQDDVASSDVGSGDEFGNGLLEGILSGSEDDSADESVEDDDDASDVDGEEELNGLEDLDSDEIPSEDDEDQDEGDDSVKTLTKTLRDLVSSAQEKSAFESDEDKPNYTVETDANGGERYVYQEIDPVYDSDDSDAPITTNTIGNIPLSFYDSYPHIGYDINGKKIMRPAKGEALDALLDSIEVPKGWTGLTDPATGKPLNLSQEELEILRRIQVNEIPEEGYDPYPVGFLRICSTMLY